VLGWIPETLKSSSRPKMPTVLREIATTDGISTVLHSHSACENRLYFTYSCTSTSQQPSFCV
jgi:hypothetical protein